MRTRKGQIAIERTSSSAPIEIKNFNGPQNQKCFVGRNLKGQIAIEYLTTYGWAILLLIIVIAVLVSSFSSSYLVAEQCNIDKSNLPCNSQVYNDNDDLGVAFEVINGFGYPIKIIEVNVTDKDGDSEVLSPDAILKPGESFIIEAIFHNKAKQVNSLISFNIKLTYQSCAHEINPDCTDPNIGVHVKTGKIVGKVGD